MIRSTWYSYLYMSVYIWSNYCPLNKKYRTMVHGIVNYSATFFRLLQLANQSFSDLQNIREITTSDNFTFICNFWMLYYSISICREILDLKKKLNVGHFAISILHFGCQWILTNQNPWYIYETTSAKFDVNANYGIHFL